MICRSLVRTAYLFHNSAIYSNSCLIFPVQKALKCFKDSRYIGYVSHYEPVSSSYFTTKEGFNDDYLSLENILKRYQTLPTISFEEAPKRLWKTLNQYRESGNILESIKPSEYRKIIQLLGRINRIDPMFMPQEVKEVLDKYSRETSVVKLKMQYTASLDASGRSRTIGRRKEAVSSVWMIKGDGQVLVNGKILYKAFPRLSDRQSLILPLKITQRLDQYNICIIVKGGGSTGQAEASALAISRGLVIHEPELTDLLRKNSCLTPDPRRVERKKPGQPKARKKNTWVKR
ncbi:hypothetical protein T552_00236 [Pneumocystis carinii B80]|uniref:Small ribosomal subunit protein uS9m n=1 Tax=Pneumocystis carinii (strain B80) TaxID=1408658 RepID=A0A0W4ZT96_PNEC8|nr:hypothetical protein T552_00236 [Pneumocystis carinii B80]KTW31598.1 hypothetical protein T552_00236 [Pneumocystis carinii B80]